MLWEWVVASAECSGPVLSAPMSGLQMAACPGPPCDEQPGKKKMDSLLLKTWGKPATSECELLQVLALDFRR